LSLSIKPSTRTLWLAASALLCALLAHGALAQSSASRFVEIEYDEAGRVVELRTAATDAPPSVDSLQPPSVRRGPPVAMVAEGLSLRGSVFPCAARCAEPAKGLAMPLRFLSRAS
jgi:hypothetical protein